jgi:non-canonical purine NTP pyrophosphatase (RdgB/HAM1 family)
VADVVFVTSNQGKADYLAKFLGHPIERVDIDPEEIQSLDYIEVTEKKARWAYDQIKKPVLVEDAGVKFKALGRLPGTLTKWFIDEIGNEGLCRLLDTYNTREATGEVCFIYYDGNKAEKFLGKVEGTIADKPKGTNGFGWENGHGKTFAEMTDEQLGKYSMRASTVYPAIKQFLQNIDN